MLLRLLRRIARAVCKFARMLLEVIRLLLKVIRLLILHSNRIYGFVITQQGDFPMALLPIAPGYSPEFTATPIPTDAVLSSVPTWTTSDETNAPITVDATGLIVTVAIPTTATVGTSFVLTISYTNADGAVATASTTQIIVAAPPVDVTGFTIEQTV